MSHRVPHSRLILGYNEVFQADPPNPRLKLLEGICKENLIAEMAALNYRLKPKNYLHIDSSFETQKKELFYFCGQDDDLYNEYSLIAAKYTKSKEEFPFLFTRQMCLFASEELIQSDLPIIENFRFSLHDWDQLLKYIFSVNTEITKLKQGPEDEVINFETLNPKMIPLNELGISTDPIYTPYRGYTLLKYLSERDEIRSYFNDYVKSTYNMTYDQLVYEVMGMFIGNRQEVGDFNYYYSVRNDSKDLFDVLSQRLPSPDISKLLSIRKYPFYKNNNGTYMLVDNILLLEKICNQFINDLWFDCLKQIEDGNKKQTFNIKFYRSLFGLWFEDYIKLVIAYSFANTKYWIVRSFSELKVKVSNKEVEIADLFIRKNSQIILGQVKTTAIYDTEKYSGTVDQLYKNNRNQFFNSFGIDQLVNSIFQLEENIVAIDHKFPVNKTYRIYPVIIFNDKSLQTPLMAKIFNDRFQELMTDFENKRVHIYPLTLIHVSDFETLQTHLNDDPDTIWDILKYHVKSSLFMPPFYNSLQRKEILPQHFSTLTLFETLISKFQKASG